MSSAALVLVTIAVIGVVVWILWQHWTPLLRYRAKRHYDRIRSASKRYLDGIDSIEDATRHTVFLLRNPPNLGTYEEDFGPFESSEPGSASLLSLSGILTPRG